MNKMVLNYMKQNGIKSCEWSGINLYAFIDIKVYEWKAIKLY